MLLTDTLGSVASQSRPPTEENTRNAGSFVYSPPSVKITGVNLGIHLAPTFYEIERSNKSIYKFIPKGKKPQESLSFDNLCFSLCWIVYFAIDQSAPKPSLMYEYLRVGPQAINHH